MNTSGKTQVSQKSCNGRKTFLFGKLGIATLIIIGLGVGIFFLYGLGPSIFAEKQKKQRVLSVAVRPLKKSSGYEVFREFIGKVEAERNSDLSFERGGLVVSVKVKEGDSVKSKQIVAQLDTNNLKARRAVLKAQLARAEATLKELRKGPRQEEIQSARADLARLKAKHRLAIITDKRFSRLFKLDAAAAQEKDDARLSEQSLQAAVNSAKARLSELLAGTRQEKIEAQAALVRQKMAEIDSLDIDINESNLLAPYAGVVGVRFVDEGEFIAAGTPVIELIEMPSLRVRVGMSGLAAKSLSISQTLEIKARGRGFQTTVAAKRPDRNPTTRTITVLLALKNQKGYLKVGDLATVTLARSVDKEGFWVPLPGLTEGSRGLWSCYIAKPLEMTSSEEGSHLVDIRPVELLYEADDREYVVGPLEEGELLISDGLHRLVPEQRVVLAKQGNSSK